MSVVSVIGLALTVAGCGGDGGGGRIAPPPSPPPPPPPAASIAVQQVFNQLQLQEPVALLQAPGDGTRWFVVELPGTVRVFDNDPGVSSSGVFLDIRARVDSSLSEGGLLGFAFHPDFANNRQVYASYTAAPRRSVISRFLVDGATGNVDPTSELLILEVPQPDENHNGGHIAFGPDGLLYIGFGDGGGGGDPFENGQDTTTLLGSIVRIDVDGAAPYVIPPTNSFANNTECGGNASATDCPEIYAWGFRNPWRFSFDQQTGELWVGDVGQDRWEEVNRVELGLNYGWDEREGAHCFEPPSNCSLMNVDPIAEYGHNLGISVTGGYVYRGSTIPALQGQYVFGDFGTGRLFAVPFDAAQGTVPVELLDTPIRISSFGQAPDGELYVVDIRGLIYQIVPPP